MNTIDFNQLITNLMAVMTKEEIIKEVGLSYEQIATLQETFEKAQALLDLHLERCPEHHTHELLLIKKWR